MSTDIDVDDPSGTAAPPAARLRMRPGLVALVIVGLLAWGVAAAAMVLDARQRLVAAEGAVAPAREAVTDGDIGTASTAVRDAADDLASARARLRNPVVAPLRGLPVVGADLRTVTAVADAGAEVTAAAVDVLDALDDLPNGLGSLGPTDGALPVQAIATLAGPLRATADATAAGVERLGDTTASGLSTEVTDARDRVLDVLERLAPQVETGAVMAEHLPGFLGAEEPRTYLLGASTPAEARNTGGFIGSVALVRFEDGVPEFGEFIATNDLPVLPPGELPAPSDDPLWGRYGGTGSWVNLNRTPDFPTAAVALEELWSATGGAEVDGMIVVDPFALEGLLELSGPSEVEGLTTLDADNVVDYVANEAYADFEDDEERKAVLGAVAAAAFEGFLAGGDAGVDPQRTVATFADLAAGGHLLVHADDPEVQAAFARTPLAGRLPEATGDLVSVTTYSGTASKVDHYASRAIDLEITLLEDGRTRGELIVAIANDAPTEGPPSYVIGPNAPGLEAGDNLLDVSVHLASDAGFTQVPEATDAGPAFLENELDRPVHRGWVRVTSGASTERRYAWTTDEAWQLVGPELTYEVVVHGQTTIRATDLSVSLRLPDGFAPVDLPDGLEHEGNRLVWRGEIRGETLRLPVRLGAADR